MVTCRGRNVMFLCRYSLFWNVFQNLSLLEILYVAKMTRNTVIKLL